MAIRAMTKGTLRFFFDFGAGGCLWAGDEATRSTLGDGPLDATYYNPEGDVSEPPRIFLPRNVHSIISRLDQEYLGYLNPLYPTDPSLWTQGRCDRFNRDLDQLLTLLRVELGNKFVIVDQQQRHAENPALGEFLAANPDQKPIR
ncbi:hypothetical protein J5277_18575 [Rhizobium sp. 16-449-1b]|uniref:hypothetical protein n=1 Tax=Rhizobium sp. 16-449-1b TaxID=2819989 RepID=UPI001ADA2CFB|nr:hypothetical protein [Rhizobium sp. 16-449-1b]MBO9196111.1 hypothetical protein [Rhizobium sp. 16-449-1b]